MPGVSDAVVERCVSPHCSAGVVQDLCDAAAVASNDVSVCLTFDFDAISVWIGPRGSRSPNLIARGEFGEVGAHRLVDLLAELGVPSTWFIPGHTIDTYPDVCARVVAGGHEVGYHGYCHEAPSSSATSKRNGRSSTSRSPAWSG